MIRPPWKSLTPETELGDEASISLDVFTTKVIEKPSAPADHEQQTTTAVMVVLVVAKMLGQMVYRLCQQSHLHLGRTGVALVGSELFDYLSGGLHYALNLKWVGSNMDDNSSDPQTHIR